jgi:hypothetical protein
MTAPGYLTTGWVLGRFGKIIETARRGYLKFVMEGIEKDEVWKVLRVVCILEARVSLRNSRNC